jgi:hypothetical protein
MRVGKRADPSGSAVLGMGLRALACWDFKFESRRGHGYLCLVSVVLILSGRGLCAGMSTRSEECCGVWYV